MDLTRLRASIIAHEGRRLTLYNDTQGIPTIGVGRNLRDVGISSEEADHLLANDITRAIISTKHIVPTFALLTPLRQEVLIEMCFNMGEARLRGFKLMLRAIGDVDYDRAAHEMLSSRWATQVGARAVTLAKRMREGA